MALRDRLKNVGFGLKFLKAKMSRRNIPLYVCFYITKNCNFRCSYCYGEFYKKEEDLPLEKIKHIIDELAKAGTQRICLLGGEPLLRDDIAQIIDYSKSKKIDTAVNTNGSLIKKRIREIKKVDHIYVSFDGSKEGHDANRGQGTYERALEGIETARQSGVPVGIVSVITKNNINDLDYLVDFCSGRKLSLYLFTAMNQGSDLCRVPIKFLPTAEEYKAVIRKIIRYIEDDAPIRYPKEVYLSSLNWSDYSRDYYLHKPPDFEHIRCYAGRYICSVDAEGYVFPCPMRCGVDNPGNIFRDGFETAWRIAGNNYCKACHIESLNEMNMFFSLNPKVIANFVRLTVRKEANK